MKKAGKLVQVGEEIEKEYGVPIINKRISVTPIAIISAASGNPLSTPMCWNRPRRTAG